MEGIRKFGYKLFTCPVFMIFALGFANLFVFFSTEKEIGYSIFILLVAGLLYVKEYKEKNDPHETGLIFKNKK